MEDNKKKKWVKSCIILGLIIVGIACFLVVFNNSKDYKYYLKEGNNEKT